MADGDWPGKAHRPARAAIRVHPAPARRFGRAAPPSRLPPILRSLGEQFLVAGPICGVLSAIYGYHLSQVAPTVADPQSNAVIEQSAIWHGHFLHHYYITPDQNLLWWGLSVPAMVWLILLVPTLILLGVRSHGKAKRAGRSPRLR